MASIVPFIKGKNDFDDELTRRMGDAFDIVCATLKDQPPIVREVVARRIIDAAKKGDRDFEALRRAGMIGLAPNQSKK